MKTYTVIFNTKTASFGGDFTGRNIICACAKAILQYHHLGARFNNIFSVEEKKDKKRG